MEAIESRRSIRAYKDKDVEEEKLKLVLNAARLSPSASNKQDLKFIVVHDKNTRKELAAAARNQNFIGEAPVVIIACGTNPTRKMRGGQFTCPIDLAIAIDHMTLKAVEEGLGTCWIGSFNEPDVKKILQIPDAVAVVVLLPIGYPAHQPVPTSRKNLEEIICYEKWA